MRDAWDSWRPIKRYLDAHDFPYGTRDFVGRLTDKELEFEARRIEERRASNATDAAKVDERAKRSAGSWESLLDGKHCTIVELCCGDGHALQYLNKAGLYAIGVDISAVDTRLAAHGRIDNKTHEIMYDSSIEPKKVVRASVYDLPFQTNSIDGVVWGGAMMMLPWTEHVLGTSRAGGEPREMCVDALKEIRRIIRPRGLLKTVTINKGHDPRYYYTTEEELCEIIEESGFTVEKSRTDGASAHALARKVFK
jgi:SAM-dependent methyltransferase